MGHNYIVMGANYGDEGKGRATNYICTMYSIAPWQCLIIKHNGGPQMGHTSPSGFVYHTFGTARVNTYLAPTFLFNPKSIKEEIKAYEKHYGESPRSLYVNQNCRVTTPIDVLMNHVIELARDKNKHGSCGLGIYATITRDKYIPITVGKLMRMNKEERKSLTRDLMLHYSGYEHAVRFIPDNYRNLDLVSMMEDFYNDFYSLFGNQKPEITVIDECEEEQLLHSVERRVFETGQGLMLDEDCKESFPHVTPSHTDCTNPIQIIKRARLDTKDDVTVPVYCTRTYLTKHGAGEINLPLLDEKLAAEFKKLDTTNVPNEWQDSIRMFRINLDEMLNRIRNCNIKLARGLKNSYVGGDKIFVTWANRTHSKFLSSDRGDILIREAINIDRILNEVEVLEFEE